MLFVGWKKIENRSVGAQVALKDGGEWILIIASKKNPKMRDDLLRMRVNFEEDAKRMGKSATEGAELAEAYLQHFEAGWPCDVIVGAVHLQCLRAPEDAELINHPWHVKGEQAWCCDRNVSFSTPIPCIDVPVKGGLSLCHLDRLEVYVQVSLIKLLEMASGIPRTAVRAAAGEKRVRFAPSTPSDVQAAKKRPTDVIAALRILDSIDSTRRYHALFVGSGELGDTLRSQCQVVFDAEPAQIMLLEDDSSLSPAATFPGFSLS